MPVIGPEQPVTIEGVTRLPPEWGIYQDLIEDIPEEIRGKLQFVPVAHMDEVLKTALMPREEGKEDNHA